MQILKTSTTTGIDVSQSLELLELQRQDIQPEAEAEKI